MSIKYERRSVFIVKDAGGHLFKVFGDEREAESYAQRMSIPLIIDEWPVEFRIEGEDDEDQ